MGQRFQLVLQGAEGPDVRQFDQERVRLGHSSIVCELAFDSPHIARKHAEIVRDADGWTIHDLGSRQGVAVNGLRVSAQRLADGDRIVLAPDAEQPTLLEFRLPEAAASPAQTTGVPAQRVGDELGPTSVVASIDLRELSYTLGQSSRRGEREKGRKREREKGRSEGEVSPSPPLPFSPSPAQPRLESTPQLPVLGLFKSAGEALLAHEALDEMLQEVVDLIAEYLPGRRCAACMVDPASGEIQPRCFSSEVGDRRSAVSAPTSDLRHPTSDLRPPTFAPSRSILQEAVRVQRAMLVARADDDPRFLAAVSIQQMGIRSAICVPLYHQGQVTGVIYVDSQQHAGPLSSRDLEVLTVLGLMVAAGMAQTSLRRLARYNSPQVVEKIMQLARAPGTSGRGRQEDEMLADEYDVSVVFADLAGFSALAENWSAAEAVRVLNLVFERWTANVFQLDGTLDKYIGDAVMAVFGAPLRQADHARRAVATALAMQHTLDDLNRSRPQEPVLQLRIGINSGRVIAGDIGSRLHKSYTVIGDVVNVASRLETSVALPGQIVIGQATFEQVREHFACEPLGEIQLRGKRQTTRAYRVVGGEQGAGSGERGE